MRNVYLSKEDDVLHIGSFSIFGEPNPKLALRFLASYLNVFHVFVHLALDYVLFIRIFRRFFSDAIQFFHELVFKSFQWFIRCLFLMLLIKKLDNLLCLESVVCLFDSLVSIFRFRLGLSISNIRFLLSSSGNLLLLFCLSLFLFCLPLFLFCLASIVLFQVCLGKRNSRPWLFHISYFRQISKQLFENLFFFFILLCSFFFFHASLESMNLFFLILH